MKIFLTIIFILSFCLVGCNKKNNNSQNSAEENISYDYTASRASKYDENNSENNVKITEQESETDIASFSTQIYTPNDESRQNNIGLTCSKLNGTIVKSRRNVFFL